MLLDLGTKTKKEEDKPKVLIKLSTHNSNFNMFIMLVIFNVIYVAGVKKNNSLIYILMATDIRAPFEKLYPELKSVQDRKCQYQNCYIAVTPDYLDNVTDFDVVMFNSVGIRREEVVMPARRSINQKYVFASQESSSNYPLSVDYNGFFNWTYTYRFDSDIPAPYLVVRNAKGEIVGPGKDVDWIQPLEMRPIQASVKRKLRNKKVAAAWFVSHCNAKSTRQEFVDKLNLHLKKYGHRVDIYGECGNLSCPMGWIEECYALIETDYYFYLSFENSFAVDYVSEKLLTAVEHYAVPIVFGGADYSRFMPDGSYIDAYKLGPEKLAKEMADIIKDKNRYYDFFRFHRYYSLHDCNESPDSDVICRFCAYCNENLKLNLTTVHDDITRWYNEPCDWPPEPVLPKIEEPSALSTFLAKLYDYFQDI